MRSGRVVGNRKLPRLGRSVTISLVGTYLRAWHRVWARTPGGKETLVAESWFEPAGLKVTASAKQFTRLLSRSPHP